MHPIERLRYVARATGAGPGLLVREAAGALAAFADDPAGLVTACRRLVQRHSTSAPVWWLAARVLEAADPMQEAWAAAEEIDEDPTSDVVCRLLPDEATVLLVGGPELAVDGIRRRGDVETLVVDAGGDGSDLVRRFAGAGLDCVEVADTGAGAAAAAADLVLVEATGLGPSAVLAPAGSRAAAAVAHAAGVPVWCVAGRGRVLPGRLWDALVAELDAVGDPWDLLEELVPLDLFDQVIGPDGPVAPGDAPKRADCPVAPELLKLSM